jgi:hypothetical protein
MGVDCKSTGYAYGGSKPPPPIQVALRPRSAVEWKSPASAKRTGATEHAPQARSAKWGNGTSPASAQRNAGQKKKTPPPRAEESKAKAPPRRNAVGPTERQLKGIEEAWPEKSKAGVDREAALGGVLEYADEGNEASAPRFRLISQAIAGLTQLVEYHPSKVAVDGSSPLARSISSLVRPK